MKKTEAERVYYDIVTAPNQSGSPIWLNMLQNGNKLCPIVLGVHTHGEVPGPLFGRYWCTPRSGTRITEQKFRQIMHIITQTLEFVCPIPPRMTAQQLKGLANEQPQPEAELRLVDTSLKALKKLESERCPKSTRRLHALFEQEDSSSSDDSETVMAQYEW